MSRKFKPANNRIPGCSGYVPPKSFYDDRGKAVGSRAFKSSLAHRVHQSQSKILPDPSPKSPPREGEYWATINSNPPLYACFVCRHGKFTCTYADPPISWMLRVRHPEVIEGWLHAKHLTRNWSYERPEACSAVPDGTIQAAAQPAIPATDIEAKASDTLPASPNQTAFDTETINPRTTTAGAQNQSSCAVSVTSSLAVQRNA